MKVLITGANGQVAAELLRLADRKKFTVTALDKDELDITDSDAVTQTLRQLPADFVINAAAYTQVDRAEEEVARALAVNRDGARHLALACEALQIPLLHYSTDYVFDGEKTTPYVETDTIAPINLYGQSKWEGEQAVRQCARHIILRTSAVFGLHGTNFVKTMLRLSRQKEVLNVVADQMVCPTPAAAVAAATWRLCEAVANNPSWGTYHFSGDRAVSWHQFAETILGRDQGPDKLTREIVAITTDKYPTRAKRPLYSVLDCSLLEKTFGIKAADWRQGLQDVIRELSTT